MIWRKEINTNQTLSSPVVNSDNEPRRKESGKAGDSTEELAVKVAGKATGP